VTLPLKIKMERMLADLKHLATFGKRGQGVNRRSLTEDDIASRQWLVEQMQTSGLEVRFQPVDATHALNLSAGVSNSKVLCGRPFN
jgi:N-carbamoyl-L-amino-acid hydrolase